MLHGAAGWDKMNAVTQPNAGRFVFQSADAITIESYWAECPVSEDLRPAGCVTASATDTGHFAMSTVCGVYGIFCKVTGKWYVGASVDVERRIRDHFYELRIFGHRGKKGEMGNDYARHGREAFRATVLEETTVEQLAEREQYWSRQKHSVRDGYNEQAPGRNRHWEAESG